MRPFNCIISFFVYQIWKGGKELKERTSELNSHISSIESKLNLITKTEKGTENINRIIKKYCKDAETLLLMDIFDNQLLKQIIESIVVYENGDINVKLKLWADLDRL